VNTIESIQGVYSSMLRQNKRITKKKIKKIGKTLMLYFSNVAIRL